MSHVAGKAQSSIVVARVPVPAGAYDPLEGAAELRFVDAAEPRSALLEAVRDAAGIISFLTDRVDADLLDAAPCLRVVANYAVGVNNVDLDEARRRGVWVTNTPGVLTEATAEVAVALMLMVLRRLGEGERELRGGRFAGWTPTYLLGEGLIDKTVGIVGFGRIGRAVARRVLAFGARVVASGRPSAEVPEEHQGGVARVDLPMLLATSDVVSLHLPLTPETRHLVDAAALARMRPSAYLINTARGPVVDEAALAKALQEGRLAGAGIDVYEREPAVDPDLLAAPNTVLLPHLGSNARDARVAMGRLAARNVVAVLRGEEPPTPVVRGSGGYSDR